MTVVAAVTGAVLVSQVGPDLTDLIGPRAYVEVDGEAVRIPRPDPADGRLLEPVAVTTEGQYAFLHVRADGGPVGYDPCRPIRYVVDPEGMPPSGWTLVAEAVAVVSAASGVQWEYVGESDEGPVVDRPLIQPDRYGDGWAPVLIAWSDEAATPELAGEVAGLGGSAAVPGADGTGLWLAAGRVVLDRVDLESLLAEWDGYRRTLAVVVHELAHVLGLDHVDDVDELMHPVTSNRLDLGPGDRAGLALVGAVACQ